MRKNFEWYFPADEAEVKSIWDSGLITLDTNVLLDLYRYHEGTRNEILRTLHTFKGRLWLSRQAAEEFFRNRAKVIVSSSSGFRQAQDELDKLRKSIASTVEQFRSNRIIPAEITVKLEAELLSGITNSSVSVEAVAASFPDYLKKDPVLEELLSLFDGAVGPAFSEIERSAAITEGERRKKQKIPPGYMDEGKDGERPYGDYMLWRQLLDHSKSVGKSIILVTSERKEDWWERPSGKTVGPRQELLREAHEFTGQRMLMYQTDRFLQFAATQAGENVDENAVQEIRAVSKRTGMPAVNVRAQSEARDESKSSGSLFVSLDREVLNFTASGHFSPPLPNIPYMEIRLLDKPAECPPVHLHCKTGTNHDFNVHVRSHDASRLLPIGDYVFEYVASWESRSEESTSSDFQSEMS